MGQTVGLRIEGASDEPIHRQIFDQVVARIRTRAFPPGFKLPPTRLLARELGTHRNTVARAYAELEAAGFVNGAVGRGTYVEETGAGSTSETSPPRSGETFTTAPIPWASRLSRSARPELLGRAERYARRAQGKAVINLARMQPSDDLLPDDLMRRCIARVTSEHGHKLMAYAPPEGVPRLREQLAIELSSRGVPTTADDVLVTSGSQQGIDLVARLLVDPGDVILVESTTYSGAIDLFTLAGARLVGVPCDDEGPDLGALERVSRTDVKAFYVMPNGHNPTGRTMSAARRRALVAWSRRTAIPLVEDDFAAGLALDSTPAFPHLRALDGDVIHLSTFSKRLIPAMRVGYVVVPAALRDPLRSMKRIVDLGSSAILQHAMAEFIERGYLAAHMHKVTLEYRARRDALAATLEKTMPKGATFSSPTHGVVMWLALPPGVDPDALYEEALRQNVLVSPSPMWTVDPRASPGLRLSYCSEPADRLVEGARRLGKALKNVMGRAPRRDDEARVLEAV